MVVAVVVAVINDDGSIMDMVVVFVVSAIGRVKPLGANAIVVWTNAIMSATNTVVLIVVIMVEV